MGTDALGKAIVRNMPKPLWEQMVWAKLHERQPLWEQMFCEQHPYKLLGRSEGFVGAMWCALGSFLGTPGGCKGNMGTSLDHLGSSKGGLGQLWWI